MSFTVIVGFLIMASLKFVEFFDETDPIEYFALKGQDQTVPIDLTAIGFTFAVEAIDEKIGSI